MKGTRLALQDVNPTHKGIRSPTPYLFPYNGALWHLLVPEDRHGVLLQRPRLHSHIVDIPHRLEPVKRIGDRTVGRNFAVTTRRYKGRVVRVRESPSVMSGDGVVDGWSLRRNN